MTACRCGGGDCGGRFSFYGALLADVCRACEPAEGTVPAELHRVCEFIRTDTCILAAEVLRRCRGSTGHGVRDRGGEEGGKRGRKHRRRGGTQPCP